MQKSKKAQEWKPTAEPWVIERDFSTFVNNRCVFVHGRARRWRSAFNFAADFTAPARIVVLYLYGKVNEAAIRRSLTAVSGQMLIIDLPVSAEDLMTWDAAKKEEKRLLGCGLNREAIRIELEKMLSYPEDEVAQRFAELDRRSLDILESGDTAEARIRLAQGQPALIIGNFPDVVPYDSNNNAFLLSVIRRLYPYGIEANAPTEAGAKRLATRRLVACAMDGLYSSDIRDCVGEIGQVQLSFFNTAPVGAECFLEDVQAWIAGQLAEKSCFALDDLYTVICAPPYGYYECNYYAYLLALALIPYSTAPYRCHAKLVGVEFSEIDRAAWLKKPFGIVYSETEKQKEMRLALREIFPTKRTAGYRSTDLHGEIVEAAMGYVSENIETPLDCADHRWLEIFRADSDAWCNRNFAEKYHAFLTDIPARKKEVENIDHFFEGRYDAEKLRLFYRFFHVHHGAVGWLHSAADFNERLEEYMAANVCRECGRPFKLIGTKDKTVEVLQAADLSVLRFTEKEIIGLNKKLLGRYQEQFFCIHCLCEVLDTTPERLKEKEETFKMQGCTLFL